MVTVLSGFVDHPFMISNAVPPPTYLVLRSSRTTSWMLQRVPANAAAPPVPFPERAVAIWIPPPACEIRLDQHANRILEFQVILDDERIAIRSADEVRAALQPL